MGVQNDKISYYGHLQKKMKKSYDSIQKNEFNREYSFKMSQFVSSKKNKNYEISIGKNLDWKFYLINRLDKDENDDKIGNWENDLHHFIENEFIIDKSFEKYILENEMFLSQFTLRNYPQLALKDSKNLHEPLLFLLFDNEELETYSEESFKNKKYNKHKKRNKSKQKEEPKNNELCLINYQSKEKEKNDNNNKNKQIQKVLTISKLNESELNFLTNNLSEEINDKYYSFQIRKHINLIRRQLEKQNHPINRIIKYFSEIYTIYINKCYDNVKKDKYKIEITKNDIIIDIQNFIDIIAIALKLFYMKSINYDYFEYEKDEFINLICFILFNQKGFEKSLFRFFELSNKEKQEQLNDKKVKFGDITPKDVGINIKFRLNEDTEKLKEKRESEEKQKEEKGIVKYFKEMDIEKEKQKNSNFIEVDDMEMVSSFNKKRKLTLFTPFKSRKRINNLIIKENDVIYKTKEKKKKERIERGTISSYREFSEIFNNINGKYKRDIYSNQSEFEISSEDTEYDPNNPYGKAIEFIETIEDYKTPLDKLTIIALVSDIITNCIDDFWKEEKNLKEEYLLIDSDELLSVYLYIIFKMNTKSLYTQLDYIQYFTGTMTKQSMIGYFYTTIDICIKFIMTIEKKEQLTKNENIEGNIDINR